MTTGMGHQNVVPRKLEIGMKVVVMLGAHQRLSISEVEAGIEIGKWLKGEIKDFGDSRQFGVEVNNKWLPIELDKGDLIIRSVARQDNLKPHQIRAASSAAARKQRREIMASVKIVRQRVY